MTPRPSSSRRVHVGLCMIVKNESAIIRRCLAHALPFIDHVLIVDTGSTDSTIEEVENFLRETATPGEVLREPWRDFAYNRSHALALLRQRADIDYALMIDADDRIEWPAHFDAAAAKAELTQDAYNLTTVLGGVAYWRPQLISNKKPFHFRGVLHEFLDCPEAFTQAPLEGPIVHAVQDSARNQLSEKYRRDAATLVAALATETDPFLRSRYTFYLAQSWRDCGETAKAADAYLARADMGFWAQEVYCSLYYAAQAMETLGRPSEAILAAYARASALVPERAEAWHAAARHCRHIGDHARGYGLAQRAIDLIRDPAALFGETWIYDYGALDEFAVHAYWTERYRDCLTASLRALNAASLPLEERRRIVANAQFALERLAVAA